MREYVTELSKFIIPALMAIYTLCSFACLFDKWGKKVAIYAFQAVFLFMIQLFLFADLALVNGDLEYVFFYAFVQVLLLAMAVMVPAIYDKANRLLLNNMCMLSGVGLCVISRLSFGRAVRQYIIMLLSLAVSLFIPWALSRIRFLKKLTWAYGILGIVMLGAVLIYSEVTYGAEISFTIGGVTFQPSEFVKILFLFFLAAALLPQSSRHGGCGRGPCGDPGAVEGPGERADIFRGLCVRGVRRHQELPVPLCRGAGGKRRGLGGVQSVCPCEEPCHHMAGSLGLH